MRIVYGINPVIEALKSETGANVEKVLVSSDRTGPACAKGNAINAVLKTAEAKGVAVQRASAGELARLAKTGRHQGAVAVIGRPFRYYDVDDLVSAWKKTGEPAFFLILDAIQDPQNLGALIRSALAAGVHGVIIPKDRACEVNATVSKASAGASEHAMIAREANLSSVIMRLKEENVWSIALEADSRDGIYKVDLSGDIALVVGSEGKGIRRLVRERCDLCLSIPLSGPVNSLNAAQAGSIAMFEIRRQRLLRP